MKVVVKQHYIERQYVIGGNPNDALLEAAKMFLLEREKENTFIVTCVIECYQKGLIVKKNRTLFNTYFVLLDAGLTTYAEKLRTKFMAEHNIDLSHEPFRIIV